MMAVSLLPVVSGAAGPVYLGRRIVLGGGLPARSPRCWRARPASRWARATFHYSLLYLALIFVALVIDAA